MGPRNKPGDGICPGLGFDARVSGIVLANDGSGDFYVGGDFTTYNGTASKGLIRLHPDGAVANTFDLDGSVASLALATTGGGELSVLVELFPLCRFYPFQRTTRAPPRAPDPDRVARSRVPLHRRLRSRSPIAPAQTAVETSILSIR